MSYIEQKVAQLGQIKKGTPATYKKKKNEQTGNIDHKKQSNTTSTAISYIAQRVAQNDRSKLSDYSRKQIEKANVSAIDRLSKGDTSSNLRKLAEEYTKKAETATYSPFKNTVKIGEDGKVDASAIKALQDKQNATISNPTNTTNVKYGNYWAEKYAKKKSLSETPSAYLERAENAKKTADNIDKEYEYAKEHPVLGGVQSVYNSALGSVLTPVDFVRQKVSNPWGQTDQNAPANMWTRATTAQRQGMKAAAKTGLQNRGVDMIDDDGNQTFAANVVDFGVDTGMSIADTGARALVAPWLGATQAGLSAGSQAFIDAKDKGADDSTALAQGIAQGVAEEFFEKYSLEGLKAFKTAPADSIRAIAKNIAKQMFTEGSEEGATEISNIITDAIIMGRDSDWEETYNRYIEEDNLTPKQAFANTLYDMAKRVGTASLGGAISGGLLGGGAQAINYKANSATGRAMRNANQSFAADELKDFAGAIGANANNYNNTDTAEQAASTKSYLEKLAEEVTGGKELTDAENGAAYNELMTTAAMAANDAAQDGTDNAAQDETRANANSDNDIDFFNNALRTAKGEQTAQNVQTADNAEEGTNKRTVWNEGFEIPEDWYTNDLSATEGNTLNADVSTSVKEDYIARHSRRYSNDEEAQSLYLEGYSGQDALDYDDALAAAYEAGRNGASLRDAVESNSVLDGFYNRNMQLVEDMWVAGYKSRSNNSVRDSKGSYASTGDETDIKHYNLGTYNRYGWTKVNNILNKKNSAEYLDAISDIKQGYNVEQAADGSYMVEVASSSDGVKDTIIYTDGDYVNPSISKVIKLNIANETEAREIKEAIYGTEQSTLDNSVIENLETEGILSVYDRSSCPTYKEAQRQGNGGLRQKSISANKGRTDGRGSSQDTGVNTNRGRSSAVTKVLKWAHDKTGYDVKLDSSLKSAAQVDLKNHVISINPYASNLLGELSHELVHVFSREAKSQYKVLHDTVIEALKADPSVDYDAMYAEYAKKYNSTDRDYIEEEIVADAAKSFLNDPEFAKRIAAKDKSLAQRIADFFRDIADALTKLAKSDNIGEAADALKANAKAYGEAAKAWYAAFEAVSNNKQTIEQGLSTSQKGNANKSVRNSYGEVDENKGKITRGMSDEARYEILKDKEIKLAVPDETKLKKVKLGDSFNNKEFSYEAIAEAGGKVSLIKKIMRSIGNNFGIFNKDFYNKDIDITFQYSGNKSDESVAKQNGNYEDMARMLSCFNDVIANAVGIEAHNRNDEGYKTDLSLKNVYILASAYEDADKIVPVKLEIKELSGKPNSLHVAITMEGIKKDDAFLRSKGGRNVPNLKPTSSSDDALQGNNSGLAADRHYPASSTIKLAQLLENINENDESFVKYIPKQFRKKNGAESQVDENKKYTVNELSAESTISDIKGTIKAYHPSATKEEVDYAAKGIREVLEATGSIQSRAREVQASDNGASVHAGWGLNMGRHGSLRDGGGVKTVGLGITRRFVRKGYIDFRGQKLSSNPDEAIQELATMAMVLRNPSFETFRIFYTKGNKIVGSEAVTSQSINASPFMTKKAKSNKWEDAIEPFAKRMKRLKADGYYMLHNHPSGNTEASNIDINTTGAFEHFLKGFKGHIIIDHNKYGLLDPYGNITSDNPLLSGVEDNRERVIDHPLLYQTINNHEHVAKMGIKLVHDDTYASVIYTDNQNKVVAIQEVHKSFIKSDSFKGYLANRKLDFGALRAFVVTSGEIDNNLIGAYKDNLISDVIQYGGPKGVDWYNYNNITGITDEEPDKGKDYRGRDESKLNLGRHVGDSSSNGDQYSYNTLTAKDPMAVEKVIAANVSSDRNVIVKEAQKDIKAVSKDNDNTIYVPDIQKDVVFGANAVRHGLKRNKNNYIVAQKVGTILSNSIGINELEPRPDSPNGSYLLLGIARDEDNNVYPTLFNVKRNVSKGKDQVYDIEVLSVYSTNSKKIETRAQSTRASGNPYTLTSPSSKARTGGPKVWGLPYAFTPSSTISIKDLLSIVKESHAEYLSDDVAKALGVAKNHDSEYGTDVKYSFGPTSNLGSLSYKELRNIIKHYTFHLPEGTDHLRGFKGEIDRLGGLRGLRREFFMTLNITKSKGVSIDTMWQELSEEYPWLFDPEVTNPADQLEIIVDALRDARANESNLEQEEFDAYLRDLETDLREQGMSEEEIEDYIDEVVTKEEEDAKKAKETTKKRGKKNAADRVGKRAKEYEPLPHNLNESERDKRLKDLAEKYGVMPKGETPLRDVTVPLKTSDDKNVRRFARTVLESNAIDDDMAEELKQQILDEAMSYEAQSDIKAQQHAAWAVDKNGIEYGRKTWEAVVNSTKVATKDDIAVGELLLKRYAEAGDTTMVMQMVAELASEGTRAGQVVQAMSMLKRMSDTNSPEGAAATILTIKKTVDKMNRDYRVRFKGRKSIPQIEIDEKLAEKYLKAESVEEREKALDELYNDLARQVPNTIADKLNQWRYLAMLGNPRTHIRNIVGNAVFMPAIALKNEIATAMEATAQKAGKLGTRTKALTVGKEYKAYAREDFEEVKGLLSGQSKGDTKNEIMARRGAFGESKIAQPFNKLARWNSNALEAEDMLFLKHHYIKALSGWLQANNIDLAALKTDAKLLAKARQYAINEAQKATYRDASDAAAALNQIARSGNRGLAMFIESVLPFKKTPINILKRGVEYSPVGLINGLTKQSIELRRGNITMNEWIDSIASGLTGTGIMILGMLLAKLGIITAAYSDDDKEKDMQKLMGEQEYAVNLFGYSYTIDWAAPSILPFMVGAEISAALDTDEDYEFKDAVEALQKLGEPMTQLSMLSGLSDTLDNISYANNKLTALVFGSITGYLGQFVPTFAGQVARTVDPVQRITYSDRNSVLPKDAVYFIEKIQNKLPYFSSLNEAKLDQWGMENRKANVFAAAFENMISPGYVKKLVTGDKVDNEIMRLYGEGVEENITPDTASRYFGQGDERKDLTSKEYHDYQETMGTLSYNILNNVVDEDWYQELNADEQAEYFGNVYDYAKTCARMEVEDDYEPTGTYSWVAKAINAQEETNMSIENYIRYKSEVTAYKGSLEGSTDEKKKQMISYIKTQKLDNEQNKILWNMAGYKDSTFTTDFLGQKKSKK